MFEFIAVEHKKTEQVKGLRPHAADSQHHGDDHDSDNWNLNEYIQADSTEGLRQRL